MINPYSIFELSRSQFNQLAINHFMYQYKRNTVYRKYCDLLDVDVKKINGVEKIPFLPISLFKTHEIKSYIETHELTFKSSGTAGNRSKHFIKDSTLYKHSFQSAFKMVFGNIKNQQIIALLPSYEAQGNSSLIYMVKSLIEQSDHEHSGFYKDYEQIASLLSKVNGPCLIIGVGFALLDLLDSFSFNMPELQILETGGMKGRREEITRMELHQKISTGFGTEQVYSEYGMTELLSQAYRRPMGKFQFPIWAKAMVRDINDPFQTDSSGSGCLNIVDLANIHSCSFIATDDLAVVDPDGSFEVLGRLDHTELRGCSLMMA